MINHVFVGLLERTNSGADLVAKSTANACMKAKSEILNIILLWINSGYGGADAALLADHI